MCPLAEVMVGGPCAEESTAGYGMVCEGWKGERQPLLACLNRWPASVDGGTPATLSKMRNPYTFCTGWKKKN